MRLLMSSLSSFDISDHTYYRSKEATRQYLRCLQIHRQKFVGAMAQILVVAVELAMTSQDTKAMVRGMVALRRSSSCLLNTDSKLRY